MVPGEDEAFKPRICTMSEYRGDVKQAEAGDKMTGLGDDENCPALDQRRKDRPQDGDDDGIAHCDIGAVEVPEPGQLEGGAAAIVAIAILAWRFRGRASGGDARPPSCGPPGDG